MSKKSTVYLSIILLAALVSLSVIYVLHEHPKQPVWTMPEPNLTVQTQTFEGLTFSLRNAVYTTDQVSIGVEVMGGGQVENDLAYEFYEDDRLFASSVSGGMYKLGDQHYYLTAESNEISELPEHFTLKINILARKSALEPHRLSATFEVPLNKEN